VIGGLVKTSAKKRAVCCKQDVRATTGDLAQAYVQLYKFLFVFLEKLFSIIFVRCSCELLPLLSAEETLVPQYTYLRSHPFRQRL